MKNSNPSHWGFTKHSIERLQNVQILHNYDKHFKRLVNEALYINMYKNNFNVRIEVDDGVTDHYWLFGYCF